MIRSIVESLSNDLYNDNFDDFSQSTQSTSTPPIASLLGNDSHLSSAPTVSDSGNHSKDEDDHSLFKMPTSPPLTSSTSATTKSKGKRKKKSSSDAHGQSSCDCCKDGHISSTNPTATTAKSKSAKSCHKMLQEHKLVWSSDNENGDSDLTDWLLSDDGNDFSEDGMSDSDQLEFLASFLNTFTSNSADLENLAAMAFGAMSVNGMPSCNHSEAKPPPLSERFSQNEANNPQLNAKKRKKKKKKGATSSGEQCNANPVAVNGAAGGNSNSNIDKTKALALLDLLSERIDAVAAGVSELDEEVETVKVNSKSSKKKKQKQKQSSTTPSSSSSPPRSAAVAPSFSSTASIRPNQIWISGASPADSCCTDNSKSTKKKKKQRHISSSSSSMSSNSFHSGQAARASQHKQTVFKELEEQVEAFMQNPYVAEYRFQYLMSPEEEGALVALASRHKLSIIHHDEGWALKKNIPSTNPSPKHANKPSQPPATSNKTKMPPTVNNAKSKSKNEKASKPTAGSQLLAEQVAAASKNKKKKKTTKCGGGGNGGASAMPKIDLGGDSDEEMRKMLAEDSDSSTQSLSSVDGLLNYINRERSKASPDQSILLDNLEKKTKKALSMMSQLTNQGQYDALLKSFNSFSLNDNNVKKTDVLNQMKDNGGVCPIHHHHNQSSHHENHCPLSTNSTIQDTANHPDECKSKPNKKKKRKNKKVSNGCGDNSPAATPGPGGVRNHFTDNQEEDSSDIRVESVPIIKPLHTNKKPVPKCDMVDAEMQTLPEGWYICYICEQEVPEEQQLTHRAACLAQQREKLAQKTAEAERRRQRRKQRMQVKQNGNGEVARPDRPCSIEDCTWRGKACHNCCTVFCNPHQLTHHCPCRPAELEPSVLVGATASCCTGTDDFSDEEEDDVDDVTLEKEIAEANHNLAMAASLSSNKTSDLTYFERCQLRKNLKMKMAAMRANRRR